MTRWLPAIAALLAIVVAGGADAATTRSDPNGTTLLNGTKVFPIVLAKGPEQGSKTPSGVDALDEVVQAGVNFFKVGPATTAWTSADIADAVAWNQAVAARGVFTWINLSTLSRAQRGSSQAALLRQVVSTLMGDPSAGAIGMWKGADEPWWTRIPVSDLQFAYCLATSRGPSSWCAGEKPVDSDHLWVTIEAPKGTGADLAPYSGVTDTHGINDYPVTLSATDPDLHQVGLWTSTIASITPSRSVWTTLQICASGSYDASGKFVLPTRKQERYMIYDAIVNGARNLAFYGGNNPKCWNSSDSTYRWSWTFWNTVLKALVQEINAASPIAPALVNPGSTKALPANDSTTRVISREGSGSTDLWVIAARSGTGSRAVTISGLPSTLTSGTAYTEGRSVTVVNGSFTDTFDRWAVHVYHFTASTPALPSLTSFTPASGPAGTRVTISGTGFTAATAVRFNGTAASYTVDSDTQISATVPGATTGLISVTTSGGTATSASSFNVIPAPLPAPPPQPAAAPTPVPTPAAREPAAPQPASSSAPTKSAVTLHARSVFTVPASAVAGHSFGFGVRIVTDAGDPIQRGLVRCRAQVGKRYLRIVSKGWRRGAAYCSWKLPRSARGKKLRGLVRVDSKGLSLIRPFTRRVK